MEIDAETGFFVGQDGCYYETEWEARSIGILGMCGCGLPEEAYNFLRDCLKLFDRRGCRAEINALPWINAEEEITKLIMAEPDVCAHAISHLLSSRGVLEHGGGVGGSWLTAKGEEIVDGDAAPISE